MTSRDIGAGAASSTAAGPVGGGAMLAAVPGDAFGDDSCVRFSFATDEPRVVEGVRRFAAWADAKA